VIPKILRIDRGTETDMMATLHCYMHQLVSNSDDNTQFIENNIFYGPSTANKIERWWRELHYRLECYFKTQLAWLLDNGYYDQTDQLDR